MEEVVNTTGVIITLTEVDTGNRFTFPMNPEEITTTCGTRFQSYDIMNIGEIRIPLGENLSGFSWSGKLPGANRYPEYLESHPYADFSRRLVVDLMAHTDYGKKTTCVFLNGNISSKPCVL